MEEDTMNPNFNWAIVAERMQTMQAEAGAAGRARDAARARRAAARARQPRRSRWALSFSPASPVR
jgi:hypothetical protein